MSAELSDTTTATAVAPVVPRIHTGASIKIIGLGGIGGVVARYGSVFLGTLNASVVVSLIDGDKFEPKNSKRMLFSKAGANKAEQVAADLQTATTGLQVMFVPVPMFVTSENIDELIVDGDIVLMCVDNHRTRRLIDLKCQTLQNIVLISGGNSGVEDDGSGDDGTEGTVQVYIRKDGLDVTPSLSKWHPEIEYPADKAPHEVSCLEAAFSSPQLLFANLAVASHMLNALWLVLTRQLHYVEAGLSIKNCQVYTVDLPNNLIDYNDHSG